MARAWCAALPLPCRHISPAFAPIARARSGSSSSCSREPRGFCEAVEICKLGAQSHVAVSFESPECTANSDALGTLWILEAVRILGLTDKTRIYQASTSKLYGLVQEIPQKESTPFYSRSPYGVA